MLCTAPTKYSVTEAQGEIRAQHSVDTIVRLLDTSSSSTNQNVAHKIRIQFYDRRKSPEPIGRRDVDCCILSYKPSEQNTSDERSTTTTTANTVPLGQQETRKLCINIDKNYNRLIFSRRSISYIHSNCSWNFVRYYSCSTNNTRK